MASRKAHGLRARETGLASAQEAGDFFPEALSPERVDFGARLCDVLDGTGIRGHAHFVGVDAYSRTKRCEVGQCCGSDERWFWSNCCPVVRQSIGSWRVDEFYAKTWRDNGCCPNPLTQLTQHSPTDRSLGINSECLRAYTEYLNMAHSAPRPDARPLGGWRSCCS